MVIGSLVGWLLHFPTELFCLWLCEIWFIFLSTGIQYEDA